MVQTPSPMAIHVIRVQLYTVGTGASLKSGASFLPTSAQNQILCTRKAVV